MSCLLRVSGLYNYPDYSIVKKIITGVEKIIALDHVDGAQISEYVLIFCEIVFILLKVTGDWLVERSLCRANPKGINCLPEK